MLGNSPQPADRRPEREADQEQRTANRPADHAPRSAPRRLPRSRRPSARARAPATHPRRRPVVLLRSVLPPQAGAAGSAGERRPPSAAPPPPPPRRPDGGDAGSFGRASKSRGGADRGAHRLSSRPADILMDGMTRPTQASCGCAGLAWGQGWQTGSTAWVEEASSAGRRKGRREEVREGR